MTSKGFQYSGKKVYMIGSKGFCQEFDKAGIEHFGSGADPIEEMHISDEHMLDSDSPLCSIDEEGSDVGAVIVGFETHFNYLKLMRAANFLQVRNDHRINLAKLLLDWNET
ncbi:unnamed protein product [Anisakis simplex]|uniref:Uncharacterized protein n=1 Tax=Anisakis simplex TaxID=6269 RepID=A0A3P6NHR8_ANISI|nr:unnamed protein product [Anisakis simplex]